ncbi:hypothetical protein BMS3Bbin11_01194 [bacterium BMS3Bbin11]|nr:hypothetical protein BMS3Abin11_02427 [bacterium BMS3Abin11]GBE46099.1 hypothetical protein BMS3Bbin11_01194 [bacterium BMS3Bbin11]HDH08999.1 hypothetical protein [Gammaproteobacteria bacterium]HDH15789.1 hypothetical protein [Gammaproteobacteria bacterium]HDZ79077.1 hypothetical protein [Gammaproteobacteria bacterium]
MKGHMLKVFSALVITGLMSSLAYAHDPIFSIGPHVLYKNGVEVHTGAATKKAGDENEQEVSLELTYGLTGDWAAGIDIPYAFKEEGNESSNGSGDISVFTKYRFWRKDSLGLQESAAVLVKVITDTASDNKTPSLDKGTTDTILGLTYGYEGRKWYRWASARYRFNGKNDMGIDRGDKLLLDLVGGIRPKPTGYLEPDTVWLLELNTEFGQRAQIGGNDLANTGGTEAFISPGIFWTKRNFAIKAGVQIPVYSDLNGTQADSDYRARLTFEWHL